MKKKFLIIQIDGLGYDILKKALKENYLPFLKKLLKEKKLFLKKFNCALPAVTSHFQSEIMYGESKDIPGMTWYEKKESKFFCCFTSQTTQIDKLRKKKGILKKGVSIGNIFNGGAEVSFTPSSFFGFPSLYFPKRIFYFLLFSFPFLIIFDFFYSLFFKKRRGSFLEIFIGEPLITKELLSLLKKFIKEKKNIFVNFIGYDVTSHIFGKNNIASLKTLRKLDKRIEKIYSLGKENYYIFILSDHGQVDCVSFKMIFKKNFLNFIKEKFEKELLIDGDEIKKTLIFKDILEVKEKLSKNTFLKKVYKLIISLLKKYYRTRSFENLPYFFAEKGILLVNQGNICQIYFLKEKRKIFIEEILEKYPDLIEILLDCWAIDFVIGLSKEKEIRVLGNRKLNYNELKLISPLIEMENSGDLILFGKRTGNKVIDFSEGKLTCHGGLEKEEQEVFVLSPIKFKREIEKVSSPKDLYKLFIKWK